MSKRMYGVHHQLIVLTTAIAIAFSPFMQRIALAAVGGPCDETVPADEQNTIVCNGGTCVGQMIYVLGEAVCANQNAESCYQDTIPQFTIVPAKTVDLGWNTFLACLGTDACFLCGVAAAAICAGTANPWLCIIGAGGCGAVCIANPPDQCCWKECQLDLANKLNVGQGTGCGIL